MQKQIGHYSFIVGCIISIVLGVAGYRIGAAKAWLWSLLVVLGIVAGLLNVSRKDAKEFLMVNVAIILISYAGSANIKLWNHVNFIGPYLFDIFSNVLDFVVAASVVVALKEVWELGKNES